MMVHYFGVDTIIVLVVHKTVIDGEMWCCFLTFIKYLDCAYSHGLILLSEL